MTGKIGLDHLRLYSDLIAFSIRLPDDTLLSKEQTQWFDENMRSIQYQLHKTGIEKEQTKQLIETLYFELKNIIE